MCLYVCFLCMGLCLVRAEEDMDPLELELLAAVTHSTWVLRIKLWPSVKAICTVNY